MTLTGLSCLRTYSLRIHAYDSLGVSTSYTSPIQVTTINCGGGGGGSSSGGGGVGGSSYVAPVVPGGSNSSGFGVSQSSISLAQLQHQAFILQEQLNSMGGGRDLQTGDTGPDVTSIQKILVAKGLLKMPKGEGFGYFGGLTKAAVMAFQKSQGISRTGVVGPKTRAALLFGSTSTNSSVAPATAPSSFKSLQQTLNKLGFVVAKTGPGSIGNETNVFGNATKEALIRFQIEYGIIKNANSQGAGVYGPKTKEKIAELAK
jgi:peptidoglycan hydrolase-like protein with peptidoglycan-binding domain